MHFELAGPDEAPLHAFYAGLFGWRIQAMGPGYALIETPDGSPKGAVRESETAEIGLGIGVADVEATVVQAVDLGGTIVMPPTDNGYVNKAQIADPAGNVVSLIENDKPGT